MREKTKVDYTLWNITEGNLTIRINGNELHAGQGDVVLFFPGDKYTAWSETGCQFLFIYFTLETGQALDLLSGVNLPGIIPEKHIGKSA